MIKCDNSKSIYWRNDRIYKKYERGTIRICSFLGAKILYENMKTDILVSFRCSFLPVLQEIDFIYRKPTTKSTRDNADFITICLCNRKYNKIRTS